jgi:5-methylcytosine-specific restriction endonuclease McrA
MTAAEQVAGAGLAMTTLPAPSAHGAAAPELPRAKLTPLAPDAYAVQVTVRAGTHDKLRYAQALLGHAVPSGDLAEVLDRALDALIERLERAKFGVGSRSRRGRSSDPRHIPAAVRRAVLERDGGCCTFTGPTGHRCGERTRLEYDHVRPVARGGEASVENLRLRCDAHNQHEADRVYGERFMRGKRAARPRGLRRHAEPPLRARPLSPQEHAASRVAAAEARATLEAMLAASPSGPA